MAKISDEIRKWCADLDSDDILCTTETLYTLADRIDNEMVELPRDRDGVPIHVGDTVYLEDGRKAEVSRIILGQKKTSIDLWMCDKGIFLFSVAQRDITHTVPDSWKRIADELEAWCDRVDVDGDACDKPRDLADRIRKLAATED